MLMVIYFKLEVVYGLYQIIQLSILRSEHKD